MAKIGIDLGTTTSLCVAYIEGEAKLIPNRFGDLLTPSVVSLDTNGEILVGHIAKERLITNPECTAASFKKDMGTNKLYTLGKNSYKPEELSSLVLQAIVDDAKAYLGEDIEEAIISVPAYFHDKQRVATKKAAELIGLPVKRLINEPSAAALSAYLNNGESQMYMVFDFGGGTLDISIVDCFENMVEIISVAGDNSLGGDDFNNAIAMALLAEHDIDRELVNDKEFAILVKKSELCKKKLTESPKAEIKWNYRGNQYSSIFTNERLIKECGLIFAKIKAVVKHALKDANLSATDINTIILAGGSSRMPVVKDFIRLLFGDTEQIADEPQTMIVKGLGNVLGIMEREESIKDYILSDICPFTLGTDVYNEADEKNPYMQPIIPRNTALPSSRIKRLYTAGDNQVEIVVGVLQGEHPYSKDNLRLGEISVSVPPKKAGEEAIDVRFTYDINGILEVDITIVSTGQSISKVFSKDMSAKELEKSKKQLQKLKIHPKNELENTLLKEKLIALYEGATKEQARQILNIIQTFDIILEKQEPRLIRNYKYYIERVIESMDSYDPFISYNEFNLENQQDHPESDDFAMDERKRIFEEKVDEDKIS